MGGGMGKSKSKVTFANQPSATNSKDYMKFFNNTVSKHVTRNLKGIVADEAAE